MTPKHPPVDAANDPPGTALTARPWAEILQQLGAEIAGPLSVALSHVQALVDTGQIDRRGLRQLQHSVEAARRAGMLGQQLSRLASGRLRLSRERLHLAQMLRTALAQRSRETQARGLQIRQRLEPIEVWADGALLYALLNALLDWALECTHTALDLRLSLTPWPAKACLSCSFAPSGTDVVGESGEAEPAPVDSLAWRLVEQTALALGVLPLRHEEGGLIHLSLEFSQLATEAPAEPAASPPPAGPSLSAAPPPVPQPLSGYHLLIVSHDRLLRAEVQDAVRHLGLIIELLSTAEEAREFCLDGPPHALIFDTELRDSGLAPMIAELQQQLPTFCAVELIGGDAPTRLSTATPDGLARIARAHVPEALPGLLTFELTRHR